MLVRVGASWRNNFQGLSMSNRAIQLALRQDIPPTPKYVLLVLSNAANEKAGLTCRRSYNYLKRETGLDRTTVIRTIQDLIRNGRIEVTGKHSADGSFIYRVLVADDNHGWLRSATSGVRPPVAENHQVGGVQQPLLVADDNQGGGVVPPNNQINQRKPNKPKKKPAAAEDPRRAAFIELVFQTRPDLVTDRSDFKALKDLLATTRDKPAYTAEKLGEYWNRFLNSKDQFHQRQGRPLRFFCLNVNAFVGNGNGTHSGNGNGDSRTVAAATGFAGARPYTPKQ